MILGTHTSRTAQDYLMIAEVLLPKATAAGGKDRKGDDVTKDYDEARGGEKLGRRHAWVTLADWSFFSEIGTYDADTPARIRIIQRINHQHEINRARYMPQNPNLIATKTVSGDVYIFDRTKHASDPSPDGVCRPDIKLKGQKKEGYGLSWSTLKQGHVLSASDDTTVCHWDVGGYQKGKQTMDPVKVYRGHSAVVEVREPSSTR